MKNSIDIFFSLVHYAVYATLVYFFYRRYVGVYLLQVRQASLVLQAELEQKLVAFEARVKKNKAQADYIQTIFLRIFDQTTAAQVVIHEREAAAQDALNRRYALYKSHQDSINQQREKDLLYAQLSPDVIRQVEQELKLYFEKNDHGFLSHTIEKLYDQARHRKDL